MRTVLLTLLFLAGLLLAAYAPASAQDCWSCGDANSDGAIDISDAICIINHTFGSPIDPLFCIIGDCNYPKGKGDANGDGTVDISDAVYLIARIFSGGRPPHCQGM